MPNRLDNRIAERNDPIARLRRFAFVRPVDAFLSSPAYFFVVAAVTVLANVLAAEMVMYSLCILLGLYLSFFGKDYLPLMPVIVCCYIAPSIANNPGRNESSIFFGATGLLLIILAAIFIASLIFRLCVDPQIGRKAFFARKRSLLSGILILGISYLLSGAFSGHYFDRGYNNLLFASLQFLSVFLLYYIFCGAVQWDSAPRKYLAWTGLCIGFVILAEIVCIYLTQPVIVNGIIDRERIYTGWGHYNNMGALLTMMIPFAFQLACESKRSWVYNLVGSAFLIGVFLTCSRVSILFAVVIYLASCLVVMFKSRNRRVGVITNVITFGIVLVIFILFRHQIIRLFRSLFANTLSMTDRVNGYKAGIQQFLTNPVFGGSFYPIDAKLHEWSNVASFTAFFPARWHNTIVQIAASCGAVGLLAYAIHRLQTIRLIIKKPTAEVLCIGISMAALLLTSMLDCHFFNIGPVLFYSVALAFAEKLPMKE